MKIAVYIYEENGRIRASLGYGSDYWSARLNAMYKVHCLGLR